MRGGGGEEGKYKSHHTKNGIEIMTRPASSTLRLQLVPHDLPFDFIAKTVAQSAT